MATSKFFTTLRERSFALVPLFLRRGSANDAIRVTESTLATRLVDGTLATPLSADKVDAPGRALCRSRARALVHKYAAFGTAWSLLPIPMATSAGLTALETHMIYWIGRVYGEEPTRSDVLMTAAGLELASLALKTVAVEGAMLVPVIGWGIKATIAAGAIEAIGNAIVQHYEGKYPGKLAA